MDSFGIGSKSKPCTKFFSTAGCPFGEGCHFLHYVPGHKAERVPGNNLFPMGSRNPAAPPPITNGSAPQAKTRMCNKINSPEGCKFGDKCHFAHSERELVKNMPHEDPRGMGPMRGGMPGRMEPNQPGLAAGSFGASATAKISIDAKLAGAIIGKGGVNSKQIVRTTGASLSIRDHESDPNLRNIELEGTFDQIGQASQMVRELIVNLSAPAGPATAAPAAAPANNYKTKLCENFTKGSCTFGDRCHFAHGPNELRRTGI